MTSPLLLWIALGLIVYTYFGFPLLLLTRGFLHRRPVARSPITPSVSMIIVAHNEAEMIEEKLENVYAMEYPPERLEVIVASDGSDDGTNEVAARYVSRGLRLLEFGRTGKIPALNAAVAQAKGEILVFSDANSMYAPDALRKLVSPFADESVGAVGGNQCYAPDGAGQVAGAGERLYWSYDRLLKTMQSRAGSMTSATGAMHATRRHLFRPVPLGVSDDFMISTAAISQGYRLVFAADACATESVAGTDRAEFDRKLRIMVRGLRSLWVSRELFNPFRFGFYSLQLFSHKLLRWSVGWLLLVALLSALGHAAAGPAYRWLALGQIAFYLSAGIAYLMRDTVLARRRYFKVVSLPFYVCLTYYAALRAWLQVLGGRRVDLWDSRREPRPRPVLIPARRAR